MNLNYKLGRRPSDKNYIDITNSNIRKQYYSDITSNFFKKTPFKNIGNDKNQITISDFRKHFLNNDETYVNYINPQTGSPFLFLNTMANFNKLNTFIHQSQKQTVVLNGTVNIRSAPNSAPDIKKYQFVVDKIGEISKSHITDDEFNAFRLKAAQKGILQKTFFG